MSRTKLAERNLPDYTRGEEIFNMVTHIIGGGIGIAALVLCVIVAAYHRSTAGVLTSIAFGVTMILLYTMSSIYHGLTHPMAKKVFQVLDHCTIYLLIAGTYTPITICAIREVNNVAGWVLFGLMWFMAAVAITLNAIDLKRYKVFSMICYIGMGWGVIFAIKPTFIALTAGGFALLLGGGICYTVGSILYGLRKRYTHSIFHIFVILGSAAHVLCILFYVL